MSDSQGLNGRTKLFQYLQSCSEASALIVDAHAMLASEPVRRDKRAGASPELGLYYSLLSYLRHCRFPLSLIDRSPWCESELLSGKQRLKETNRPKRVGPSPTD